jgi:hypothetical protein
MLKFERKIAEKMIWYTVLESGFDLLSGNFVNYIINLRVTSAEMFFFYFSAKRKDIYQTNYSTFHFTL